MTVCRFARYYCQNGSTLSTKRYQGEVIMSDRTCTRAKYCRRMPATLLLAILLALPGLTGTRAQGKSDATQTTAWHGFYARVEWNDGSVSGMLMLYVYGSSGSRGVRTSLGYIIESDGHLVEMGHGEIPVSHVKGMGTGHVVLDTDTSFLNYQGPDIEPKAIYVEWHRTSGEVEKINHTNVWEYPDGSCIVEQNHRTAAEAATEGMITNYDIPTHAFALIEKAQQITHLFKH